MGWEVRFLFRLSGKLQFVGGLLSHRRRLVFVVGGERQQAVSRHLLSRHRPARSSPSPFASPLPPPMVFRGGWRALSLGRRGVREIRGLARVRAPSMSTP